MDADTQAVIVKFVWLVIGLILGYGIGVLRTTLRLQQKIEQEVHECHVALHEQRRTKDEQ